MSDLDGDTGMQEGLSLDLIVAMSDAEGGAFPPSACEDNGVLISSKPGQPAPRPRTGADPAAPLIIIGLLLGTGTFLVHNSRRRGASEA